MIYIVYQSPWPIGGSTTFTAHLVRALAKNGTPFKVVKLGKASRPARPVRGWGFDAATVRADDLVFDANMDGAAILVVASDPKHDENDWVTLAKYPGTWTVFHDPNEFKIYPQWKHLSRNRVIVIRKNNFASMPKAKFIPHPYNRSTNGGDIERLSHACSLSRVASIKGSHHILEANARLPEDRRVKLLGFWDRLWHHRFVKPRYPDVTADKGLDPQFGLAATACLEYRWMVDLTKFKNDGGGSQYSFLEAMDAGAVPVMSKEWVSYEGDAKHYGPAVSGAEDLYELLADDVDDETVDEWRQANFIRLRRDHDPLVVAAQYVDALLR